jgi:hypothetical protein
MINGIDPSTTPAISNPDMARELVMPLIGQTVNIGGITTGYVSDIEDER